VGRLNERITTVEQGLRPDVAWMAPALLELYGVWTVVAAGWFPAADFPLDGPFVRVWRGVSVVGASDGEVADGVSRQMEGLQTRGTAERNKGEVVRCGTNSNAAVVIPLNRRFP
jgi:hypothetical protein